MDGDIDLEFKAPWAYMTGARWEGKPSTVLNARVRRVPHTRSEDANNHLTRSPIMSWAQE